MPSMLQSGVYGSVLHYLRAVQKAGTDDADKVAAAMREIPIDDIFSTNASIREDGKVVRDMWLARVKKPRTRSILGITSSWSSASRPSRRCGRFQPRSARS